MMKNGWMRAVGLALCLGLCAPMLPAELPGTVSTAHAASSYGTVTQSGVRVRKEASSLADYNDERLQPGDIVTINNIAYSVADNVNFYLVSYQVIVSGAIVNRSGYIMATCLSQMNETEAAQFEAQVAAGQNSLVVASAGGITAAAAVTNVAPATPTPAPAVVAPAPGAGTTSAAGTVTNAAVADDTTGNTVVSGATGMINAGEVNLREGPSTSSRSLCKLDRGTVVSVLSIPSTVDSNHWYQVQYNGTTGYVMATFLNLTSGGTTVAPTAAPVSSDTVVQPTAAPAATAIPSGATTVTVAQLVTSSANLRAAPSGTKVTEWVGAGNYLGLTGSAVNKDGYNWYPVDYNGTTLYVRGDCIQLVTVTVDAAGNTTTTTTSTSTNGTTANSTTTSTNAGWGTAVTITSGVNLRNKPAGSSLEQLPINTALVITGAAETSGNYTWYPVRTPSGSTGYIRADCLTVNAYAAPTPVPTAVPAEVPEGTTGAGTTVPGGTTTAVTSYGYVKTTISKVNFRKSPGGEKIGTIQDKGTVLALTGPATTSGGYNWYPVNNNGVAGYLRGDCVSVSDATGGTVGSTQTSTGTSTTATYVITTKDKVYLRSSASKDSSAKGQVPINTVMSYTNTTTSSGSKWYHVNYNGSQYWMMGSCLREYTSDEYAAYIAAGGVPVTVTPNQSSSSVSPTDVSGYLMTTSSGLNVRATAGGSKVIGRLDKGLILPFSITTTTKGVTWYYVYTQYGYGYLHGNYVQTCLADGTPYSYNTSGSTTSGVGNSTAQEATYSTLRLGSTGSAVKALVTELKNQGYYSGSITSTYTSTVQSAVKSFQRAKGLSADGVAGPTTQHALFGTVPEGSTDASNLTMAIYPAEKIDWYTGGIQTLWAKGSNYKIYDVKTGIVWWAHRWSGGLHVDAEPLTAADTARLCRIYGVSNAQQIADKNLYQRRPCLVTIGNHTYACSLYGVPHNYPEGDTIASNNFKGQLCIHFSNSKTHGTSKVDSGHMEAIQYAYDHAPNGHI